MAKEFVGGRLHIDELRFETPTLSSFLYDIPRVQSPQHCSVTDTYHGLAVMSRRRLTCKRNFGATIVTRRIKLIYLGLDGDVLDCSGTQKEDMYSTFASAFLVGGRMLVVVRLSPYV